MNMPRNQVEHMEMKEAAHTPGPWYVTEGPTYGINSHLKVEAASTPQHDCGMVICDRNISTLGYDIDMECRANMNLIAAAPELLEALKKLIQAAKPELPVKFMEQFDAVVAKATK